jgi:hypothetical protein
MHQLQRGPGFDPSIRRHSGIWRAADEAVLNIVQKKKNLDIEPIGNNEDRQEIQYIFLK